MLQVKMKNLSQSIANRYKNAKLNVCWQGVLLAHLGIPQTSTIN